MLPRPRIRIPLWLAVAIVAATYLVRSVLRGFDFRPDIPIDAFAAVLFVLVLGMVAYLRGQSAAEGPTDEGTSEDAEPKA